MTTKPTDMAPSREHSSNKRDSIYRNFPYQNENKRENFLHKLENANIIPRFYSASFHQFCLWKGCVGGKDLYVWWKGNKRRDFVKKGKVYICF